MHSRLLLVLGRHHARPAGRGWKSDGERDRGVKVKESCNVEKKSRGPIHCAPGRGGGAAAGELGEGELGEGEGLPMRGVGGRSARLRAGWWRAVADLRAPELLEAETALWPPDLEESAAVVARR